MLGPGAEMKTQRLSSMLKLQHGAGGNNRAGSGSRQQVRAWTLGGPDTAANTHLLDTSPVTLACKIALKS